MKQYAPVVSPTAILLSTDSNYSSADDISYIYLLYRHIKMNTENITAIDDLLNYYRNDLRDNPAGLAALKQLEITAPEVVDHFDLGWCSGNAVKAASAAQVAIYKKVGLIYRGTEKFVNCIVIPVYDEGNRLVDLVGIRQYSSKGNSKRYIYWQKNFQGLIGCSCLSVFPEIILTDSVFLGLHVRQYGFSNVVALRNHSEIKQHIQLLKNSDVHTVHICSRKHGKNIASVLKKTGIEVSHVHFSTKALYPPRESFICGEKSVEVKESKLELVSQANNRLNFIVDDITFMIESAALSGLGMRCQIKVQYDGKTIIDKLDLASASNRQKFSRMSASKLSVSSNKLENHLNNIADAVDNLMLEQAQETVRVPKALSAKEKAAAYKLLQNDDLLQIMSDELENFCGIVGEDQNRKLAILISASRLLPQPLGCIIRGDAGSGKSSLITAAAKLLPPHDVLFLSRLTPQALYFLPKDHLQNKLLIVDEYEGLSESEYSLRTMMSSQLLSLAITVREGGKLPSTKLLEIPATLAVMVSSTQEINVENLSRFVEMKMDTSPEQTKRVMQLMASPAGKSSDKLQLIRNANQLLKPCDVLVPFADKLIFESPSVLARRQFSQVIGLIKAHCALLQALRQRENISHTENTIIATQIDYKVVHGLLNSIVHHSEEVLSPFAMKMLNMITLKNILYVTIKDVMQMMCSSYSKAYRALSELHKLNLVTADRYTSGVERVYQISPYASLGQGLTALPDPDKI